MFLMSTLHAFQSYFKNSNNYLVAKSVLLRLSFYWGTRFVSSCKLQDPLPFRVLLIRIFKIIYSNFIFKSGRNVSSYLALTNVCLDQNQSQSLPPFVRRPNKRSHNTFKERNCNMNINNHLNLKTKKRNKSKNWKNLEMYKNISK